MSELFQQQRTARAGTTAVAWLLPAQAPMLREVAAASGITFVAAGSPQKGQSAGVAAELGCEPVDDLRAVLATTNASMLMVAATGSLGEDELRAVIGAASQEGRDGKSALQIISFEPIPGSALDLAKPEFAADAARVVHLVPSIRVLRGVREAHEAISGLGAIRLVTVETFCSPVQGSLGSRVFDAIDFVRSLMGEPELADASHLEAGWNSAATQKGSGSALDSLTGLNGEMSLRLRFADGRAAMIAAGDQAPAWMFRAMLLGEKGMLNLADAGFVWTSADGQVLDQIERRKRETPSKHAAIIESMRRLLDPNMIEDAPPDHAVVLAVSQAALLSTRTHLAESPATVRGMMERR